MSNLIAFRWPVKIGEMIDPLDDCAPVFHSITGEVAEALRYDDAITSSERGIREVYVKLVRFSKPVTYQDLQDWLADHRARGGTFEELVALYKQHAHHAKQLDNVVASGQIMQGATSSFAKVERRHDSCRLLLTPITSTWPAGTYFCVVFDRDLPSST